MPKKLIQDKARERLIEAAIKTFSQHGYQGASTRLLTQEAGVNISAISYYFGDKRGLYRATLESIANTIKGSILKETAELRAALLTGTLDEEARREALHAVIRSVIGVLLGGKISTSMAQIFLREQMEPTEDFSVIFDETMRPMHEFATALIAQSAGLPFPSEAATLAAHSIIGQIAIFKTHREAAWRRLGWKKYTPQNLEKIAATVCLHADFIIDGYRRRKEQQK